MDQAQTPIRSSAARRANFPLLSAPRPAEPAVPQKDPGSPAKRILIKSLIGSTAAALILALLPRPAPAQAADAADGGAMPRTRSASSARPYPRFVAQASAAAPSAASAPTLVFHPQRVVVTTVEAWTDLAVLSQRATAAIGARVRDLTILGPHSVAMTLVCADAIRCDEALTRLKLASSFASQVEVDNRRMLPHRPTPDQSR
jgi:hypothetical protein